MADKPSKTEFSLNALEKTSIGLPENETITLNATRHERAHAFVREKFLEGKWRPFTPLPPSVDPKQVPGCTLQAVIGTGGMGTVYLAKQNALNRQVAVKVLNAKMANDPGFISKLRQEAQIMGTLTHPNLVGCHDIIVSKDGTSLLMEYIPGHLNARTLVRLLGPMPENYVALVLLAAAKGLAYAYEKGYTHRDVKPDNLLFAFTEDRPPQSYQELFESPDFRVAICDFGIASTKKNLLDYAKEAVQEAKENDNIEELNPIIGSPLYMAPEQAISPENVDCRSDIYSLAATAFFLLTGQPPFPGKVIEEIIAVKTQLDLPTPVPPAHPLDHEFARILAKMGAVQQEDRFQNYDALLERLEALAAPYSANTSFRILTRRYRKFLRKALAIAIAFGFLCVAGLYSYTWWVEHYEDRLFISTVNLANWTGALSTWKQTFDAGHPMIIANEKSEPITFRETIQPGENFRISLSLQEIGLISMVLHQQGHPENVLLKITCYRKFNGNTIQMDVLDPKKDDGSLTPLPIPVALPDTLSQWISLRIQYDKGHAILWNRDTPLGVAHFNSTTFNNIPTEFTITKVSCQQVRFNNIAHIRQKYTNRMKDGLERDDMATQHD